MIEYTARRRERPHFANARSVRNALDRARLRHASRHVSGGQVVTREDLMTLESYDFRSSRVFTDDP